MPPKLRAAEVAQCSFAVVEYHDIMLATELDRGCAGQFRCIQDADYHVQHLFHAGNGGLELSQQPSKSVRRVKIGKCRAYQRVDICISM